MCHVRFKGCVCRRGKRQIPYDLWVVYLFRSYEHEPLVKGRKIARVGSTGKLKLRDKKGCMGFRWRLSIAMCQLIQLLITFYEKNEQSKLCYLSVLLCGIVNCVGLLNLRSNKKEEDKCIRVCLINLCRTRRSYFL